MRSGRRTISTTLPSDVDKSLERRGLDGVRRHQMCKSIDARSARTGSLAAGRDRRLPRRRRRRRRRGTDALNCSIRRRLVGTAAPNRHQMGASRPDASLGHCVRRRHASRRRRAVDDRPACGGDYASSSGTPTERQNTHTIQQLAQAEAR